MLDRTLPPAVRLMSQGGDARIAINPQTGINRYLSAPMPAHGIAYASSTANDLSPDAFAHVEWAAEPILRAGLDAGGYAEMLEGMRCRLRTAYGLDDDTGIVFAPSGTDLEYVALAAHAGRGGIRNILLAPDEVGSGCILSAAGRFFAESTALRVATEAGTAVPGLGPVDLSHVAIRDEQGPPLPSEEVARRIEREAAAAVARGHVALVHIVHGSKTGLILPDLAQIDALRSLWDARQLQFVVDACQARIDRQTLAAYLDRGIIVLLSGSKFMGGAPFSGFALVPRASMDQAQPLPHGLAHVFRRAEWPREWKGRAILPDSVNAGLALRIESALFELERFVPLSRDAVGRVVQRFQRALSTMMARNGITAVPGHTGADMLIGTLATLDLRGVDDALDFDAAVALYRRMAADGVRLGQPVRCLPGRNGTGWAGTLRIALSMPQIVTLERLSDPMLDQRLCHDMGVIERALQHALNEARAQNEEVMAG
ncbi:MAG: hypothetical protein U5M50_02930 [Sphingobium sp.]|nr:hypothetical protein [Sphingobium sp.]